MANRISKDRLEAVVAAVAAAGGSARLTQIRTALTPPPPLMTLHRWLAALVRDQRLLRTGQSTATRYSVPGATTVLGPTPALGVTHLPQPAPTTGAIPMPVVVPSPEPTVTAALRVLVRVPLTERPPATYNSGWMHAYRPNETFYLPEAARTALRRSRQDVVDARGNRPIGAQPWAAEMVFHTLRLDGATLSLRDVRTALQDDANAPSAVPPDVQRVRNYRKLLARVLDPKDFLGNTPGLPVMIELMNTFLPAEAAIKVRSKPVVLASAYQPPADCDTVAAQFGAMAFFESSISDPVERAFFLLVHLSYLQPFTALHAQAARLNANLPLLRAGLAPFTFAGVSVRDFDEAMLAVWELNRVDLLRELVLREAAAT